MAVANHTTDKRIRGATLQAIRRKHFAINPLCVICLQKKPPQTRLATQLDHIKPLHQGGLDVDSNRQGLCEPCHIEKSKTERGHAYYPKISYGADGYPIAE